MTALGLGDSAMPSGEELPQGEHVWWPLVAAASPACMHVHGVASLGENRSHVEFARACCSSDTARSRRRSSHPNRARTTPSNPNRGRTTPNQIIGSWIEELVSGGRYAQTAAPAAALTFCEPAPLSISLLALPCASPLPLSCVDRHSSRHRSCRPRAPAPWLQGPGGGGERTRGRWRWRKATEGGRGTELDSRRGGGERAFFFISERDRELGERESWRLMWRPRQMKPPGLGPVGWISGFDSLGLFAAWF